MNCKPGDLAVIVRHDSPNYGRVVVIRCEWDGRSSPTDNPYKPTREFSWVVEGGSLVIPAGPDAGVKVAWHVVEDRYLRPLRDNPGTDETLTWAPVPHKETA